MKHLTILSYSLMQQCVDSFLGIAADLRQKDCRVEHVGLTDFASRESVRQATLKAYQKHLPHVYVLPDYNGSDFLNRVDKILKRHSPDILLTDNERANAVCLINYLQGKGIPSVMIDHGFLSEPSFIYQNPCLRFIKHQLMRFNDYRVRREINLKDKTNLLMKNPPGMKGNHRICATGTLNETSYLNYGVDKKRIVVTGFPYFDRVVEQKEPPPKKNKILIVSSGLSMLSGKKVDAEQFARFIISAAKNLGDDFEITLRFKPGENIFSLLSPATGAALRLCNFKFDALKQKSYEVAAVHDVVMGDPSFVLLEAMMIKRPIILFNYRKALPSDREGARFFREKTGCLVLEDPPQIRSYLKTAFSAAYRKLMARNLQQHERELYGKLDGNAGKRVADVILKAVSPTHTN